jgi:hypothetical protein
VKHVKINEHADNSTYIGIYNKQIEDVPIILCFCCERIFFKNKLIFFSNIMLEHLQIQIERSSTTYICTSSLHNINKNKTILYQVPNKICRNKIIPLVHILIQFEEHFISSHFAFKHKKLHLVYVLFICVLQIQISNLFGTHM